MLSKYGSPAETVFDLLGQKEVDLTAALGWVLSQSPSFLGSLLRSLGVDVPAAQVSVALEVVDAEGRTDIELTTWTVKIVIEAKKGWLVPEEEQLTRYRSRFDGFEHALLVSLSDSSEEWARTVLPETVDGIPVRHIAWDLVRSEITSSRVQATAVERRWLKELEAYMGKATSVRPYDDQWVYCVVLNDTLLGDVSLKDYATRERVYFHPFGGNNTWPKIPPNFLCFRWGGQVRQVNRVVSVEVVPQLQERWPAISESEPHGAHLVYELGPNLPVPAIGTKGTYANGRVWCLLDQLLVQPTLADAARTSKALAT